MELIWKQWIGWFIKWFRSGDEACVYPRQEMWVSWRFAQIAIYPPNIGVSSTGLRALCTHRSVGNFLCTIFLYTSL
jgi:hypothetical protein